MFAGKAKTLAQAVQNKKTKPVVQQLPLVQEDTRERRTPRQDKSTVECYGCHEFGNFRRECPRRHKFNKANHRKGKSEIEPRQLLGDERLQKRPKTTLKLVPEEGVADSCCVLQHHTQKGETVGSQQRSLLEAVVGNQQDEEETTGNNVSDGLDGLIEAWDLEEIRQEQ